MDSHYGPGIFDFFLKQNEKISKGGNIEKDAHYIHLDTLGIVNGLIDIVVQGESLITYPYNNVSAQNQRFYVFQRSNTHSYTSRRAMASKSSISLCTTSCCTTGHDPMAAKNR